MKLVLFVLIFLAFVVMSSLYISKEDKSLEVELKSIKHPDIIPLIEFHNKFSKIDIDSKGLDLNKTIIEIKKARKLYPLDNTLLRIDIELEHRRANEAY
ncbi:hypothetical protein [Sulfurimonas sp. CS5]|jgi:regulator of protease activity HflC (stomatin/prohibitin superfamily)|uniref:hypothetical protein n=1 Tax=Sulfurimonas sp. CS5 TaxID=3391145 RepID=UPI0039E92A23